MRLRDKYAIVGIGMTAQGAVPGRTSLSFHLEACVNAMKDAGVPKEDVDGLICYRQFPPASNEGPLMPYLVAQHLGLSPTYMSMDAN
jgi:3-oxoacyl-[acyl-carrier-protein] synthase III